MAGKRLVIGQIGQSLDGRVAHGRGGPPRAINGPDGLLHLHRLRALVDAVVVGVGTAIADDPRLSVRLCRGADPVPVVIDPRGRLPGSAGLCRLGGILVTSETAAAPPGLRTLRLPTQGGRFAIDVVVAALGALGLRRLLVEGGPATLCGFLAAGGLDRLHVSLAPCLLGAGRPGLDLPLEAALRPPTTLHHLGSDLLFDLDLKAQCAPGTNLSVRCAGTPTGGPTPTGPA